MISEAEDAAKPPECDSVRARVLADKAKQLIDPGGDEIVIAKDINQKVDTPKRENVSRKHTGNRSCEGNSRSISEFTDQLFSDPIVILLVWSALAMI